MVPGRIASPPPDHRAGPYPAGAKRPRICRPLPTDPAPTPPRPPHPTLSAQFSARAEKNRCKMVLHCSQGRKIFRKPWASLPTLGAEKLASRARISFARTLMEAPT